MTRWRGSLVGRLILGQLVVLAAMTTTTLLVAATLGPGVFHDHLHRPGHPVSGELAAHAEEAFFQAGGLALGAGIALGVLVGLLVSVLVTRSVGRTISGLSTAAGHVAAGVYDTPLPGAGAGREVDTLVESFRTMADRLANTETSRRRLLTDVAHELRTPISAIRVTLEAIDDGVLAPDAATLATLRDQTARLERLAGDIRGVSAAEEGRLDLHVEDLDITEVVDAAAAPFRLRAREKGVELVTRGAAGTIRADRERIEQVLTNLLANALRHTPAGGAVTVEAAQSGNAVTFAVRDTGAGIAAEHLPHVFERFYRADTARDRDHGGSGVGLTISRGIAAAHGGSLTVASGGPGQGATFILTVPTS